MEHYDEVLCPECNGPMAPRTSQYGTFWGCKKYPACKGKRDSDAKSKYDRARERGEAVESPAEQDSESNGVRATFKKKKLEPPVIAYIYCSTCGKAVSTGFIPVPTDTPDKGLIVRAFIQCPECIEKKLHD